ncbi:hypothetical protein ACF0H5_008531 [Mactra antiquata]
MMYDTWREILRGFNTAQCSVLDARTFLVVLTSLLTVFYFKKKYNGRPVPSRGGWIPWLGCAIQFGKGPLQYIGKMRDELGPVFSLKVAGENLTFISDVEDFHHFFHSKSTSFQMAVQQPVQKLGCVSEELFFRAHTKLHDQVKSFLSPRNIKDLTSTLSQQLNKTMNEYTFSSDNEDLMNTVQHIMYKSILNTLWGDNNPFTTSHATYEDFIKKFKKFDGDFEYGAKLPSMLLPKWIAARSYLLNRMKITVNMLKDQSVTSKQSLTDALWEVMGSKEKNVHGFAMLLMFASLANAIPASCWTLIFVLTNKPIFERLMTEINDVLKDKTAEDFYLTDEDLQKMKYLRYCVYETLRLRCEGAIARRVINPINIKGYTIPAGHMLMISPYWIHRDPRYFDNPHVFNPDRWEHLSLDMKAFVAFGGGRYMCPGRWFGIMGMQSFVAMFLYKFKCTALSQPPKPSTKHIIGVQHPESQFLISYDRR